MSTLRMLAQSWRLSNPLFVKLLIAAPLLVAVVAVVAGADTLPLATQWPMGGRGLSDRRNQPFTLIGVSNVKRLKTKWVFTTGGSVSATPAVVNGAVYFPDWPPVDSNGQPIPGPDGLPRPGTFYAVGATTGQLIWSHKISDWTQVPSDFARDDPAFDGSALFFGDQGGQLATFGLTGAGAKVMAVNATTGQLIWVTQVDKFPGAIITGSPVVFNGIVYVGVSSTEEYLAKDPNYPCCSFRGSVVALDEASGNIIWQTYDMPSNPAGYTGGAVWDSTPVVDASRGSLYVGTGNNYTVPSDVAACIINAQLNSEPDSDCNGVDDYAEDYFDSVLALDLQTGTVKWAALSLEGYDAYTYACQSSFPNWCPSPMGRDYDFGGAGPNFFRATINGASQDVLGIGQKSGIYWALNPDNGQILWNPLVGPGSFMGGIQWGTATDGQKIYVPIANATKQGPINGGSWAALDTATGAILWQTAAPPPPPPLPLCQNAFIGEAPGGCMALGPATVGNGVVYAGSMDPNPGDPTMFALNAATGQILWSFAAGSQVVAGPAIVGNSLYWGAGYRFGPGSSNNKLYAFTLPSS
jgi:polyvinyl alcohol dehydrogenase (cytochrome)